MNNNQVVCPKCGNVEPAGNAFCSKCGAPFAQPQQPQQPQQPPVAPVYNPNYNQGYYPPAPPMEKKKLYFIIALAGIGLNFLCSFFLSIFGMAGNYDSWVRIFDLFGSIGFAGAFGGLLMYIKERFDEKK